MTKIARVEASWILDSRAKPTVEATVYLSDGRSAFAHAPSGASTGRHESVELRDVASPRFGGMGVQSAIDAVRNVISPSLSGLDVENQALIDSTMVELDGTDNRARLGANAMVAVSAACARAASMTLGLALWQHLGEGRSPSLPIPMVNLFSGNKHAQGSMSIQDVLIVPVGARDLATALEWIDDVYWSTRSILDEHSWSTLVGDEGGFASPARSTKGALDLTLQAIGRAGRQPGVEVAIALDVAASHMLQSDATYLLDGDRYSSEQVIQEILSWTQSYPIVSVEDPLGEDDWKGWHSLAGALDPSVQLLGDDLICTHLELLERAANESAANAVLVKANQIGTLSEALNVADRARELGMESVISARSGETEDDWLADFAVGSGSGQIKIGSVARSERLAKYNRLLRISRGADSPPWSQVPDLRWPR